MANISKIKRDRLIQEIAEIKNAILKSDDEHIDKGKLLTYINNLEKEVKSKKYGLVFEEHREGIDDILDNNVPVLTENEDLFIDNDGQMNFLIEGDNLASLKLLEKTHKGRIDVIYIDPPYNTGNKDFIYDDKIVDDNDLFSHSKWLSFMKKRLTLSLSLLSNEGLIFISIDDNEMANLVSLCDAIFGSNNMVSILPRIVKKGGKSTDKIAKNHDYLLIFAKNIDMINLGKVLVLNDSSKQLIDEYYDERGPYRLNQCLDYDSLQYNESMDYPIEINGQTFYAGGSKEKWIERHNGNHKNIDWVWRWSKNLFEWGYNNGFVVIKNGKRKRLYTKTYANCKIEKEGNSYKIVKTENTKAYDSLYFIDNIFSNDNAKKEFDKLDIGKKFDYPKPTNLITEILKISNKKDALILDFFAGSGTTGHATMKLNAEDGGNRKFILCTNNENNICKEITYERIKRVIEKEDYKASLKYMKVDYVPTTDMFYSEYEDELLAHVKELVELENGINFKNNKEIAIVLTDDDLEQFCKLENNTYKIVYFGYDILPTEEQRTYLKAHNIKINIVPDYYYKELEG